MSGEAKAANSDNTSAGGAMYRSGGAATILAVFIFATPSESVTASNYEAPSIFERTVSGPDGQVEECPLESTSEVVLEIRRRSGLTWDELGTLFNVTRRSVHHWASGKALQAKHERMIRRMLVFVRRLDQGSQFATRARLLRIEPDLGDSSFELMRQGRFEEVSALIEGTQTPGFYRVPLSPEAQSARRPPPPGILLDADPGRLDTLTKGRAIRVQPIPKRTS